MNPQQQHVGRDAAGDLDEGVRGAADRANAAQPAERDKQSDDTGQGEADQAYPDVNPGAGEEQVPVISDYRPLKSVALSHQPAEPPGGIAPIRSE